MKKISKPKISEKKTIYLYHGVNENNEYSLNSSFYSIEDSTSLNSSNDQTYANMTEDYQIPQGKAQNEELYKEQFPILVGIPNETIYEHTKNISMGDWNQRFQTNTELIRSFGLNTPYQEKVAISFLMINLSQVMKCFFFFLF